MSRIKGGRGYRQGKAFKDAIRQRDGYTCQICGEYGDQIDHIIPFAVLPETTPEGVRILCRPCNLATRRQRYDSALPLNDWYADLEWQLVEIRNG